MADIKISELEPTTDLEGLYTIGADKNNLSKKVSLQFLKDAANYANEQGDYAKQAGDTVNGNVGVSDYPEFSASKSYVIGDIVRYNGVLYSFTANHAASAWNGSDVKATSINAITSEKLTELEKSVASISNFIGWGKYSSWEWHEGYYISENGSLITGANLKYSSPVKVKRGDVVIVNGAGTNISAIALTDQSASSYIKVIEMNDGTNSKDYAWTAPDDCYIAISGRCNRDSGDVTGTIYISPDVPKKTEFDIVKDILGVALYGKMEYSEKYGNTDRVCAFFPISDKDRTYLLDITDITLPAGVIKVRFTKSLSIYSAGFVQQIADIVSDTTDIVCKITEENKASAKYIAVYQDTISDGACRFSVAVRSSPNNLGEVTNDVAALKHSKDFGIAYLLKKSVIPAYYFAETISRTIIDKGTTYNAKYGTTGRTLVFYPLVDKDATYNIKLSDLTLNGGKVNIRFVSDTSPFTAALVQQIGYVTEPTTIEATLTEENKSVAKYLMVGQESYAEALFEFKCEVNAYNANSVDEYLDGRVRCANQHSGGFIFLTDTHWDLDKGYSVPLAKYVMERLGINSLVYGGDVLDQDMTAVNALYKTKQFMSVIADTFGYNFLFSIGDHDLNTFHEWSGSEAKNNYLTYTDIYPIYHEQLKKVVTYDEVLINKATTPEEVACFKMHYRYDDRINKVRYIILNTGGPMSNAMREIFGYGNNVVMVQLDFLAESLMTLPEGYSVIVCGHKVIDYSEDFQVNAMLLNVSKIMSAFKIKSSTTIRNDNNNIASYYAMGDHIYDFSSAPKEEKIFGVCGDSHHDASCITQTENGTYISRSYYDNVVLESNAILWINTQCDKFQGVGSATGGNETSGQMTAGTITEQCLDVITWDAYHVFCTRVGANVDRTFNY